MKAISILFLEEIKEMPRLHKLESRNLFRFNKKNLFC